MGVFVVEKKTLVEYGLILKPLGYILKGQKEISACPVDNFFLHLQKKKCYWWDQVYVA